GSVGGHLPGSPKLRGATPYSALLPYRRHDSCSSNYLLEANMNSTLPESAVELLNGKNFGNLATQTPEGHLQVTPVWVTTDGENVIINTTKDRHKTKYMEENPQVAIDVLDPENPYRYASVTGKVVEITEQGAEQLIHELSQKYNGHQYPLQPGEQRVTVKIAPENVIVAGR
ncbi:MAG: PPOX class F420-dependent oxidoreductase, partial [Chloroflexota bacterium]